MSDDYRDLEDQYLDAVDEIQELRAQTTTRRYLLFVGDQHYPRGGWGDYKGSYSTIAEAPKAERRGDWWHIVDLNTGEIVAQG